MLEQILGRLAKAQYPPLIILILLTVTSFFAYYAIRIETNSSFDVLYRDDSDTIQLQEQKNVYIPKARVYFADIFRL